jgi:23S rRNA (uracil-5-)-methyltransferase RumA
MEPLLQKDQTILLTIKRLGINGEGIGYYKRKAVFVPGLIPPEEAIVRITDAKKNYATGEIVNIRIKAAKRTKPFCKHYYQCGGCQTQHITYDEQLLLKAEMLEQTIERYTGLTREDITINDMVGMNSPHHYRHKAQMPVENTKHGLTTGLYKPQSNDLVPILECPVHTDHINIVNQKVLEICDANEIYAFDPKTMRGLLRYIVTRESHKTGEIQVTLVITIFNKVLFKVAEEIAKISNVVSVGISKNHDKQSVEIFGQDVEILAGKDYIEEGIGDIIYELKPKAFYQLNPSQAIKMYTHVKSLLDFKTDQTIVDAYCGAGAISLYLAPYAKKVIGIDRSEESIYSALHNKKKNKFNHVEFEIGDTHEVLKRLYDKGLTPDVLIFDPPRSGLDNKTLDVIMRKPINKIVYVSCNPSTLAKNLKVLLKKYNMSSITPFDMFPQTAHIESVTLLTKK